MPLRKNLVFFLIRNRKLENQRALETLTQDNYGMRTTVNFISLIVLFKKKLLGKKNLLSDGENDDTKTTSNLLTPFDRKRLVDSKYIRIINVGAVIRE